MYQQTLNTGYGPVRINSLKLLGQSGLVNVNELPYTTRILLESLMRNQSRLGVSEQDLIRVASRTRSNKTVEISFLPTRVIMQDASGVPALVDFASLRQQLLEEGTDPHQVNSAIPVDLVIDHSVRVDDFGSASAFSNNLHMEYERNQKKVRVFKMGTAIIYRLSRRSACKWYHPSSEFRMLWRGLSFSCNPMIVRQDVCLLRHVAFF